ncbi:MAG: hypothetical protein JWR08_1936 [Enterovirga sp.]|nr:hypothetical protein [Enterovirga sp.]
MRNNLQYSSIIPPAPSPASQTMLDARVKDWTSEEHGAAVERSYRSLLASFAVFCMAVAAVWLVLFGLYKAFPYAQNGSQALADAKRALAGQPNLFPPGAGIRVLAFGNSKTLAGLQPGTFDRTAGPGVVSINFAIPGEVRFLDLLEATLAAGNRPTHLLVQQLPIENAPTPLDLIKRDKAIANWLFPFRGFVRDLVVFAYESRRTGGVRALYAENAAQVAQAVRDRGYFFIASQSHYPGHRLPADYRLPTDAPGTVLERSLRTEADDFRRLVALAEAYDFQVVLVPAAYRSGEFAEPPAADDGTARRLSAFPRIHVVGPAYWTYPPGEFSDPVHLNGPGAARYTHQLAELFARWRAGVP